MIDEAGARKLSPWTGLPDRQEPLGTQIFTVVNTSDA